MIEVLLRLPAVLCIMRLGKKHFIMLPPTFLPQSPAKPFPVKKTENLISSNVAQGTLMDGN